MGTMCDLRDVCKLIVEDSGLLAVRERVERELANEIDPGHDLSHMLRVAMWTIRLNPEGSKKNAIAAALLHDFVNPPKNMVEQNLKASELSAQQAKRLLEGLGNEEFSQADVEDICLAIRDHSFSRGAVPTQPLGKALQDADRLEALGVLGMFRNISCGARMHAQFFHVEDPWNAKRQRTLDDKKYSMDHYPIKLFQLTDKMNTEMGKMEAIKRTERMKRILAELGEEIGFEYQ